MSGPKGNQLDAKKASGAPLRVLFEDNHHIAVFKPARVLTQGDETGDPSLMDLTKAWLKEKYRKPGNVFLGLLHRLDRPVAGVVLFAKTSKGASRLSEQFRTREVSKIYWAVVEGNVGASHGELRHYLRTEETGKVTLGSEPYEGAKVARLSYRRLEESGRTTLLEVTLETGRKHQIRAQLAAMGHPIVGDTRYGASRAKGEGIALIAKRLEFRHPIQSETRVTIELPDELHDLRSWLE
jgi:23S rRNA pseudouridine1911/1915/1917 synthase